MNQNLLASLTVILLLLMARELPKLARHVFNSWRSIRTAHRGEYMVRDRV